MDPNDEIGALVQNLDRTQRRLQELTVGQVDAVVHPCGHAYLLHKAQEKLQHSETVQRQLAGSFPTLAVLSAGQNRSTSAKCVFRFAAYTN